MSLYVRIKKKLGKFMLDVDMTFEKDIVGILGASGCGKSMTLRCIAGIETPDEGQIILDDRVLFDSEKGIDLPPQKRHVGYLFQSYALFPNLTVEENIAIGCAVEKSKRAECVREKIEKLHLVGLEKKRPPELSGGQQQRVAIARLLASEPEIIMLDEPFSALDSHLKWQVEQEIAELVSTYKGYTLIVSHNRDEIYRLCNRVAVITDGHVDAVGEKDMLFENPDTRESAILTGCKNVSAIERISEFKVRALDWGIELEVNHPVSDEIAYIGIRAHFLKPICSGDSTPAENYLKCTLVQVIENPFSWILMASGEEVAAREDNPWSFLRSEVEKAVMKKAPQSFEGLEFPKDCLLLLKA